MWEKTELDCLLGQNAFRILVTLGLCRDDRDAIYYDGMLLEIAIGWECWKSRVVSGLGRPNSPPTTYLNSPRDDSYANGKQLKGGLTQKSSKNEFMASSSAQKCFISPFSFAGSTLCSFYHQFCNCQARRR